MLPALLDQLIVTHLIVTAAMYVVMKKDQPNPIFLVLPLFLPVMSNEFHSVIEAVVFGCCQLSEPR